MGGQALKNCKTRRYDPQEYDDLSFEVAKRLIDAGITCTRIPSYFSKESHGDLDMLVKSETLPPNWTHKIVDLFAPEEYVKNGNVLSFEFKEFQVDLIATPEENWLSSFQYFAFNDLGNLLGRLSRSIGVKLGHDGLTYYFYADKTQVFKEITLLKDWKDILPVLGLSYERWSEGFETLDDIFDFVLQSPFFHKDIFALENRNHAARTRDKKRKTYTDFLKYIENWEHTPAQVFEREVSGSDNTFYLPYLFEKIPSFKEQWYATHEELQKEKVFKERFNGNLVREWTELDGKELGNFMQWLKANTEPERFKKDIITLNPVCVPRLIEYYFEKWKAK